MHVHVGRKKRHAVQPSVRCCLPANGTSPKYSSTLSVDMLLSDRDTLDSEPLDASSDPAVGNCSRSSSVSVSMSRDLRLYTYWQIIFLKKNARCLAENPLRHCEQIPRIKFARDHYYSARIAVIAKLSTFVFYTRIFTVDIKIPPWSALRRGSKSHDGKMKPILSRWKFIETKRPRAGTREICHVNRRENKYAWST